MFQSTCLFLFLEGSVDKYLMEMGFSGYPEFVGSSTTDIKVKLTYKGSHAPASGKWKMSVYGSATKNPGKEALIQTHQVLNEQDQNAGDDVDFTSNAVVLTGMNGCSGDNYACFIVYRGAKMMNTGCMKFNPSCGPGNYSNLDLPPTPKQWKHTKLCTGVLKLTHWVFNCCHIKDKQKKKNQFTPRVLK